MKMDAPAAEGGTVQTRLKIKIPCRVILSIFLTVSQRMVEIHALSVAYIEYEIDRDDNKIEVERRIMSPRRSLFKT